MGGFYAQAVGDGRITSVREYLRHFIEAEVYNGNIFTRIYPYKKEIEKARRTLRRAQNMSLDGAKRAAKIMYRRDTEEYEKKKEELGGRAERCKLMLEKISEWKPPSKSYNRLKKRALNELREELRMCASATTDEQPKKFTGIEYKRRFIEECELSLKDYIENHRIQVEAAKRNRNLVDGLERSFPEE